MRNLLIGFVAAFLIIAVALGGYDYWRTRQLTHAVAVYLFSETEVKGKDGEPLSRADLLDALLRNAVSKAAQQ